MYSYIIIDDESIIRKGTEKKLEPLSDQIRCIGYAENGQEGLALIEKLHPDIVILDMQMPVMDGTMLLPYLAEHYPDMPLIVISGYRNFDYISHAIKAKAIDYILKPFSRADIQKSMKDAIAKLQDARSYQDLLTSEEQAEQNYYEYDIHMLQNLIMGYQTSSTSLTSKRLSFIKSRQRFFLLTVHFSVSVSETLMRDFIEENEFEDRILWTPHVNNPQIVFLLFFPPETAISIFQNPVYQAAEDLEALSQSRSIAMTVGISNEHSTLDELHSAFLETVSSLNSQFLVSSDFHVYYYAEESAPRFIAWQDQDEFLFRIEAGMCEETEILMDKLFDYYRTIPECSLADVKYHCSQLAGDCRQILNAYLNPSTADNDSSSMLNIVNSIFSLSELKTYYCQFFVNIARMLQKKSVYAIDDTIEKIKIYIERNYQKNLTQEFVSCLFYLNRSYLSHLFKEKTGEKFIDYLNSVRIEQAKYLLSTTDRKTYQIAKAVGYDNTKYFFRIFKKKEKMTPEQYRTLAFSEQEHA